MIYWFTLAFISTATFLAASLYRTILPCDFCTAEVFFQQCQLLVASDSEFSMAIPDKIKQDCKI